MSDLIKRSDAIEAIEDLPNAYNGWSDAYDKAYIIGTLEEVPSADRPRGHCIDLVRCAECKKVREDGGHANCGGYLYCRKWKTLVDEDQFCSWGERREP